MRKLVIPKTYRLGGVKCEVTLVDKIESETSHIMGDWDDEINLIRLATKHSSGKGVSGDKLGHVFFHELTHSILDSMGHKLSHDEGFVDSFGKHLYQFAVTQSGTLITCDPE